MGDSFSAIRDDEDSYYYLCRKYKEESQGDPYGKHAAKLEKWAREGKPTVETGRDHPLIKKGLEQALTDRENDRNAKLERERKEKKAREKQEAFLQECLPHAQAWLEKHLPGLIRKAAPRYSRNNEQQHVEIPTHETIPAEAFHLAAQKMKLESKYIPRGWEEHHDPDMGHFEMSTGDICQIFF